MCKLTSWDNDDNEKNDDTSDQTHAHLHILPPHLLANSIGTSAETLGGNSEVIGLVLQVVEILASLRDLVNVITHHANGIIDLLYSG